MKKVFVYFKQAALCESVQEAEAFINSLGLECNPTNIENLTRLYAGLNSYDGRPLHELAPTGVGKNRVYIYDPLGETLEEHQRVYEEKLAAQKEAKRKAQEEYVALRNKELMEIRKGWYGVEMMFSRARFHPTWGVKHSLSEFSGEVIASSGADAYTKTIMHLLKKEDVLADSEFPSMESLEFRFTFLGVKTDDGYSVEKWEEWMKDENFRKEVEDSL